MNYICSWLCADEKGSESLFPQTGKSSSSKEHQDIYWRCLLLFYMTSKRFNKDEKHLLFTNVKQLPVVDGRNVDSILNSLNVDVIFTDFKYKTPKGYYGMFQNQFYEFSILEYISAHDNNPNDQYLVLDSDCIFLKPVKDLFDAAQPAGFISFEDPVLPEYVINGLSRNDLKSLYEEFLHHPVSDIPSYHLGEFFLASVKNITRFYEDFTALWPQLIERYKNGLQKFNEEAHTLSYLYYKNGFRASKENHFMRRIWTNPTFYRDVEATDINLYILHLPSEKTFGLERLYNYFINRSYYAFAMDPEHYNELIQKKLGIPHLPLLMRVEYYIVSYYRAISKRLKKKFTFPAKQKALVAAAAEY